MQFAFFRFAGFCDIEKQIMDVARKAQMFLRP